MKKLLVTFAALAVASAALAQPGALIVSPVVAPNTSDASYRMVIDKINVYETTLHNREVITGKIWDIGPIEDGTTAYLICDTCESIGSHWWIVAHPVRGVVHPSSGQPVGTLNNIYIGPTRAYFVRSVEDSVYFRHNGNTQFARYYDQQIPPELARLYTERDRLRNILYPPAKGEK